MSLLNVSDCFAAATLAWNLYHNCYLVAREAPDEFRKLVNELASLQQVMRTLRDEIQASDSYAEKVGEHKAQALQRTIDATFQTLRALEKIVAKYHRQGISEGGLSFWGKIRWSTQQGDIERIRNRIMVHCCNLNLVQSSIGNATLNRLEQSLERFGDITRIDSMEPTASTTLIPDLGSESNTQVESTQPAQPSPSLSQYTTERRDLLQSNAGVPMQRQRTTASSETATTLSSDIFEGTTDSDTSSTSANIYRPSHNKQSGRPPRNSDATETSYSVSLAQAFAGPPQGSTTTLIDLGEPDRNTTEGLLEEIQNARRLVHERAQATMTSQIPLRTRERPDLETVLETNIVECFQRSRDTPSYVTWGRTLKAKEWLKIGTWWALKSKTVVDWLRRKQPSDEILARDKKVSLRQAKADLLKAAWILYEVILKSDSGSPPAHILAEENKKLCKDLEECVKEGLRDESLISVDVNPREQDLELWEDLQPSEERGSGYLAGGRSSPDPEPDRWITVEKEDAGFEDEKVLFRSFINATIGSKNLRTRAKGAPYLLLLWTKEGQSEAKITLCNQSGSLNLSRDFLQSDINACMPSSDRHVKFPGMQVSINFLVEEEYEQFVERPRRFFTAVRDRNPRDDQESKLFRTVLDTYEHLNVNGKQLSPREYSHSCELIVYETPGTEGWQTVRRLVLSSSAGNPSPWCKTFFLPMSQVQLSIDDSGRLTTTKWSDIANRITTTKGTYNPYISYVYKGDQPNNCYSFLFSSAKVAKEFKECLLYLRPRHILDLSPMTDFEERYIYMLPNADGSLNSPYKSLLILHKRTKWHYSKVYHISRESDFSMEKNGNSYALRLRKALVANYLSNHVDILSDVPQGKVIEFSKCEKSVEVATVEFEILDDAQRLLKSLTEHWDLKASSSKVHVVPKSSSTFFSRSKSYEKLPAEIAIWERKDRDPLELRLTVRWEAGKGVDNNWLAAALSRTAMGLDSSSSWGSGAAKGTIHIADSSRGRLIDVIDMNACASKPNSFSKAAVSLIVYFQTVKEKEEFAEASNLYLP